MSRYGSTGNALTVSFHCSISQLNGTSQGCFCQYNPYFRDELKEKIVSSGQITEEDFDS